MIFGKEIGVLELNHTTGAFKLTNRGVVLSTSILDLGETTKDLNDAKTIGGFGDVSLPLRLYRYDSFRSAAPAIHFVTNIFITTFPFLTATLRE